LFLILLQEPKFVPLLSLKHSRNLLNKNEQQVGSGKNRFALVAAAARSATSAAR